MMQNPEYSCRNFIYIKEDGYTSEKCLCPPEIYKKAITTVKERRMMKSESNEKEESIKRIVQRLDVIEQKIK